MEYIDNKLIIDVLKENDFEEYKISKKDQRKVLSKERCTIYEKDRFFIKEDTIIITRHNSFIKKVSMVTFFIPMVIILAIFEMFTYIVSAAKNLKRELMVDVFDYKYGYIPEELAEIIKEQEEKEIAKFEKKNGRRRH